MASNRTVAVMRGGLLFLAVALLLAGGCDRVPADRETVDNTPPKLPFAERKDAVHAAVEEEPLVYSARKQVGVTVTYDPSYVGLAYPGGDIPPDRGVCTDVVIRALRDAYGMDLQQLVHEDMTAAFSRYPNNWGLRKTDRNIDHRRVPNLRCYFKRRGWTVEVSRQQADYLPGDIVTCRVGGRPHIMIVSNQRAANGNPLVIHNIGRGTREEDRLFAFSLTGHYRIPSQK